MVVGMDAEAVLKGDHGVVHETTTWLEDLQRDGGAQRPVGTDSMGTGEGGGGTADSLGGVAFGSRG